MSEPSPPSPPGVPYDGVVDPPEPDVSAPFPSAEEIADAVEDANAEPAEATPEPLSEVPVGEPFNPPRPGASRPVSAVPSNPEGGDGHWSMKGAIAAYRDVMDVIAQGGDPGTKLARVVERCQKGLRLDVPELPKEAADPEEMPW